ncbi:MAG: hypothetical protein NWE92_03660 [Candidatus Bathyarchaeota archaeon]|nr:hypothetical protein [Candidatus Bathyarchaeota archaeon]
MVELKTTRLLLLTLLVLSTLVGSLQNIEVADANPPVEPKFVGMKVTVTSPVSNQSISSNNLLVNFRVDVPVDEIYSLGYPKQEYISKEARTYALIELDKKVAERPTFLEFPINYSLPQRTVNYSFELANLTQGQHTLLVRLSYDFQIPGCIQIDSIGDSGLIYFTILSADAPPYTSQDINYKMDFLSPNSNLAHTGSMQLHYNVEWAKGNWTSWIKPFFSFSIDNKTIVDTNGGQQKIYFKVADRAITETNDTIDISKLSNGEHTLTVYAWGDINEANVMTTRFNYTLATFNFVVDNGPFSLFPSSSLVILGLVIVTAISVSLVYFRRRRLNAWKRKLLSQEM